VLRSIGPATRNLHGAKSHGFAPNISRLPREVKVGGQHSHWARGHCYADIRLIYSRQRAKPSLDAFPKTSSSEKRLLICGSECLQVTTAVSTEVARRRPNGVTCPSCDSQKVACRGNDMTKTSPIGLENFDRFMEAMARLLGISRKKLDRIMFQGKRTPHSQQHESVPRSRTSSNLAIK